MGLKTAFNEKTSFDVSLDKAVEDAESLKVEVKETFNERLWEYKWAREQTVDAEAHVSEATEDLEPELEFLKKSIDEAIVKFGCEAILICKHPQYGMEGSIYSLLGLRNKQYGFEDLVYNVKRNLSMSHEERLKLIRHHTSTLRRWTQERERSFAK